MPPSSDQSSKKTGKQRMPVTASDPYRRDRSKAHRGNLAPFEEQSPYQSTNNRALVPARSAAFREGTHGAPPSYNDDASTEYVQDDQESMSSEEPSQPVPHAYSSGQRQGDTHNCDYRTSTHNDRNDTVTNTISSVTTNVTVEGHVMLGDAASGKLLTDFLEKFMVEHFKNAKAETQA